MTICLLIHLLVAEVYQTQAVQYCREQCSWLPCGMRVCTTLRSSSSKPEGRRLAFACLYFCMLCTQCKTSKGFHCPLVQLMEKWKRSFRSFYCIFIMLRAHYSDLANTPCFSFKRPYLSCPAKTAKGITDSCNKYVFWAVSPYKF
jgi:hypothetical protein